MTFLYPWLLKTYKSVVFQHKSNKAHFSLIINSYPEIGDDILIKNIILWLMCEDKKDIFSCKLCHGCKLVESGNHPDIYSLNINPIGIETIRNMINNIYNFSQRGGKKIIYIDADNLTEYAANALLKILEEPPNNSWFIIKTYNIKKIISTIRSRCIILCLSPPKDSESLPWLRNKLNNIYEEKICLSALKISKQSPLLALEIIKKKWHLRSLVIESFFISIKKNIFKLLPVLNHDDVIIRIDWICYILIDVIKIYCNLDKYIINIDQKKIINEINKQFSLFDIYDILENFYLCRNNLLNCNFIKYRESILIEHLFILEKKIKIKEKK